MIHTSSFVIPTPLRWARSLALAVAIASVPWAASAVPVRLVVPVLGQVSWGSAALAQGISVSPDEIMSYARSVLEMEGPRTAAFSEIRTLLAGSNVDINSINLRCTAVNNLNQLPRNLRSSVRTILLDYCNEASQIVQANGLRNERFDAITAAYPQDPTLAEQIRTALMQLQQQQSQENSRPSNGSSQ